MNALQIWQETLAAEETAVVFSPVNRRYLTGFDSSDGILLTTRDQAFLFLDSRYYEMAEIAQAKGKIPPQITLRPFVFPKDFTARIEAGLVKIVLFEDRRMTVAELEKLTGAYPKVEFVPMGDRLENLRIVIFSLFVGISQILNNETCYRMCFPTCPMSPDNEIDMLPPYLMLPGTQPAVVPPPAAPLQAPMPVAPVETPAVPVEPPVVPTEQKIPSI
ncbi:MAG: aminopeptidase P family N-terminal domain-containing protein, partial [Clostridia bacterium]|nr:aminopeptidase P family N-terminal domain-containing protein [Clostridia bacterium]